MDFADWCLCVESSSIFIKDALHIVKQSSFLQQKEPTELLQVIFKGWTDKDLVHSEETNQLMLELFPVEVLEQIPLFELNMFACRGVLHFLFQLSFLQADFYHRLLLVFMNRLGECKSSGRYLSSAICIIEHKHNVIDINITSEKGDSLLCYALWRRQYDLVKCLLDHGINIHFQNKTMHCMDCIANGDVDLYIPLFLKYGLSVKRHPLCFMLHKWNIYFTKKETIQLLLQHGIDYNIMDDKGKTVRDYTCNTLLIQLINIKEFRDQITPCLLFSKTFGNNHELFDRNVLRDIIQLVF
jgi:hypothetical protein